MKQCVEKYMPNDRQYDVVDFGSRCSPRQTMTHRDLLREHACHITGVDIKPGRNVDVVMTKPYKVPLRRNSADIIFSGQVFEHVPFFWASFLELARVLRPGGYLFITVPSRGHVHDVHDCWRFYPDGMRALAAFSGLEVIETRTDFPPTIEGGRRHDFGQIRGSTNYWGDTVGVFRKPAGRQALSISITRGIVRWWANRVGGIADSKGASAEINEVLARNQTVSVVFDTEPRTTPKFVLRSRERKAERLYAVRRDGSGRHRVDIPVTEIAVESQPGTETWDAFAQVSKDDGASVELRLGKHLHDIPARELILTIPNQQTSDESVVITPYYTRYDNFSIRCRRKV
jgi:hypothetical protein